MHMSLAASTLQQARDDSTSGEKSARCGVEASGFRHQLVSLVAARAFELVISATLAFLVFCIVPAVFLSLSALLWSLASEVVGTHSSAVAMHINRLR